MAIELIRTRTQRTDLHDNADVLQGVNLVLEAYPITSVYLSKLAGRNAESSKLHYTRQSSSVLVAHKTSEFTCHAAGPQHDPPRTSQLEAVGIVVSAKHPPSATFLAPAMADHLLNRCVCVGWMKLRLTVTRCLGKLIYLSPFDWDPFPLA